MSYKAKYDYVGIYLNRDLIDMVMYYKSMWAGGDIDNINHETLKNVPEIYKQSIYMYLLIRWIIEKDNYFEELNDEVVNRELQKLFLMRFSDLNKANILQFPLNKDLLNRHIEIAIMKNNQMGSFIWHHETSKSNFEIKGEEEEKIYRLKYVC